MHIRIQVKGVCNPIFDDLSDRMICKWLHTLYEMSLASKLSPWWNSWVCSSMTTKFQSILSWSAATRSKSSRPSMPFILKIETNDQPTRRKTCNYQNQISIYFFPEPPTKKKQHRIYELGPMHSSPLRIFHPHRRHVSSRSQFVIFKAKKD